MTESVTEPAGGGARFRRRRFLAGAAAGAATLALPAWLRPGGGSAFSSIPTARATRFRQALRIPPVLTGTDLTIPMTPALVQVLPGEKTPMWTYGGTFPGPTIRRPAGEQTKVTFTHGLPASAGELTVHLHGGHNRSDEDGQPGGLTTLQPRSAYCDISPRLTGTDSGNDLLISPGGQRTYTYDGTEGDGDERASFQWYHDHRLDNTARNVWRGLAGMWIIDDDFEAELDLPSGDRDLPLMITDRAFTDDNRIVGYEKLEGQPPFDQVTGGRILVNGVATPFHPVTPQRHRLRLLNASNFRAYNLYFENGLEMVQIATESGLMPRAVSRKRILLGPGERVEIVVDFAGLEGKRVRLMSGERAGKVGRKLGSKPYVGDIMQFRVGPPPALPDETFAPVHGTPLRGLPAWATGSLPAVSHTWKITVSNTLRRAWLINGKSFNPARVDEQVRLGSVVKWKLKNATAVGHLLHLHQTDWYMLKRNGERPPAHERCLKETFFLDPGDEVVVAGKLSDHLGKFVVHCHMLDHEDHGLMSQFEVVP